LSVLKEEALISLWTFDDILPGAEWNKVIQERLNEADLILLLVSKNFLASPACRKEYLQEIQKPGKIVIPIIISSCPWKDTILNRYQALPNGGVP
jgi:hypothetical protein